MGGWLIRIIIGASILILAEFYFTKRISWLLKSVFPNKDHKKYKKFKMIFFILLNLYPAILIFSALYRLFTENRITHPDTFIFDYLLVYPFWILFLFMLQTGIFFLVIDILRIILRLFLKNLFEKINPLTAKFMLAVLVFFFVYVPIRIIYDYKTVSIRVVEYKINDLPEELENFKITFIADIQADKYTDDSRLQNFIDKVNSTDPDLILIAGDLISSTPEYIQKSADYLGTMKSKFGIYSCVGDHDNWAYREDNARSIRELTEAMKKKGIYLVDNSKREMKIDKAKICITFITNTYVETINDKLLDSLTYNNENCDLKIFLTHQPMSRLVEKAFEENYDLFLAGHTHGGQITLLFPFVYITPTMFETKYIRGDFWFDRPDNFRSDMLMIVTRGLGMSLAPIRYNSTPEVTLITLQSK